MGVTPAAAGELRQPAAHSARSLAGWRTDRILGWITVGLVLISVYAALFYAPVERTQGLPQKIFYFHVPLAWDAYLAFFFTLVGSIAYLRTKSRSWDIFALASAELGVVLTTLVLVSGSIWGKTIWGTWWTWDARLTST